MKRIGKSAMLKERICSEENIRLAIKEVCRQNPKHEDCRRMREDAEPYINEVKRLLESGEYQVAKFKTCKIYEKGKYRLLRYTGPYPDGVIQHCITQVIGEAMTGTYVSTSYASIKGKSIHRLNKDLKHVLGSDKGGTRYCLKLDVKKYYDNIDRNILKKLLKKKMKDPWTLELLFKFIDATPGRCGIPIGNYLSNYLSNFYLSFFDHFCKEVIKVKYYFRYMDDIVILASNKTILHRYRMWIQNYLSKNLKLRLKSNHQIFPVDARAIDFVGWVFRHSHTRVRKRVKKAFIKACRRIIDAVRRHDPITPNMLASIQSYIAHFRYGNSRNLLKKYLTRIDLAIDLGEMPVSWRDLRSFIFC